MYEIAPEPSLLGWRGRSDRKFGGCFAV